MQRILRGPAVASHLRMIRPSYFRNQTKVHFHFYGRSIHPNWFHCPMDLLWIHFSEFLSELNRAHLATLKAFILLPNHFHGVVEMEFELKDQWAEDLNNHLRNRLERDLVLEDQVHLIWIKNLKSYKATICYIYGNPFHHGVTEQIFRYPYSTFTELLGYSDEIRFFVIDDIGLIHHPAQVIKILQS